MKAKQATELVLRILGVGECPKEIKEELTGFLDLLIANATPPVVKPKMKDEANQLKPEENTIDLGTVDHFALPKEFNLAMEGQEGTRKIKIFPDGLSEDNPTVPLTN